VIQQGFSSKTSRGYPRQTITKFENCYIITSYFYFVTLNPSNDAAFDYRKVGITGCNSPIISLATGIITYLQVLVLVPDFKVSLETSTGSTIQHETLTITNIGRAQAKNANIVVESNDMLTSVWARCFEGNFTSTTYSPLPPLPGRSSPAVILAISLTRGISYLISASCICSFLLR
jgi:hypothetical protein